MLIFGYIIKLLIRYWLVWKETTFDTLFLQHNFDTRSIPTQKYQICWQSKPTAEIRPILVCFELSEWFLVNLSNFWFFVDWFKNEQSFQLCPSLFPPQFYLWCNWIFTRGHPLSYTLFQNMWSAHFIFYWLKLSKWLKVCGVSHDRWCQLG